MTHAIFVVPKEGLIIRNPDGNYMPLPPEGASVPDSPYWRGQARDGSVTIKTDPAEPTAPAAPRPRTTTTRTAKPAGA